MSQFPGSYSDPFQPTVAGFGEQRTSGLAIGALISSLLAVIPCCGILLGPLGAILGISSFVTIGSNPALKGRGLAMAAIVIGLALTVGQVAFGMWIWSFGRVVVEGPTPALQAGFNGDIAGFKQHFHGAGATANDAEAQAFIDELRRRYGEFAAAEMTGQFQSTGGGTESFPYALEFDKQKVSGDAQIVFADEKTGAFVKKLGSITVRDATHGDLAYPTPPPPPPPPPPAPAGGGAGSAP